MVGADLDKLEMPALYDRLRFDLERVDSVIMAVNDLDARLKAEKAVVFDTTALESRLTALESGDSHTGELYRQIDILRDRVAAHGHVNLDDLLGSVAADLTTLRADLSADIAQARQAGETLATEVQALRAATTERFRQVGEKAFDQRGMTKQVCDEVDAFHKEFVEAKDEAKLNILAVQENVDTLIASLPEDVDGRFAAAAEMLDEVKAQHNALVEELGRVKNRLDLEEMATSGWDLIVQDTNKRLSEAVKTLGSHPHPHDHDKQYAARDHDHTFKLIEVRDETTRIYRCSGCKRTMTVSDA